MDKPKLEGYNQAIDILLDGCKDAKAAEQALIRIIDHVNKLTKKYQTLVNITAVLMRENLPEIKL